MVKKLLFFLSIIGMVFIFLLGYFLFKNKVETSLKTTNFIGTIKLQGYTFYFIENCTAENGYARTIWCGAKTDQMGKIWMLSNISLTTVELWCNHEVCHNVVDLTEQIKEENLCNNQHFTVCDELVNVLNGIPKNWNKTYVDAT